MKKWSTIIQIIALCFCLLPWSHLTYASAYDDPSVSVKLINYLGNPREIQLSVKGQYIVKEDPSVQLSSNSHYSIVSGPSTLTLNSEAGTLQTFNQSFTLTPENFSTENQISINQRAYLGEIRFTLEGQTIRPMNTLPLEDYLKGVIPSEMPASWSLEALKAQAIAARTFTMTKKGKIIDDTTNYQVYSGYRWFPSTTNAVDQTKGQVILDEASDYAQAVYSSSNGGMIESSQNVWGNYSVFSYLTAKEDPYDPKIPWTLSFHQDQLPTDKLDLAQPDLWWNQTNEVDTSISKNLKSWLQKKGFANTEIKIKAIPQFTISDMKTSGNRSLKGSLSIECFVKDSAGYRMENGLLKAYRVDFPDLSINQIRFILDPTAFKSNLVDSLQNDGVLYNLKGLGFGHGVGMSQYGAKAMADQGKQVEDILAFYYPGTHVTGPKNSMENTSPNPNNNSSSTSDSSSNTNSNPIITKPVPVGSDTISSPAPQESHDTSSLPSSSVIIPPASADVTNVNIQLNGKKISFPDQQPYIELKDHRTMVPIRFVSESLGAKVDWDSMNEVVSITQNQKNIKLKIGETKATVGTKSIKLDTKAILNNNRTFVPLRFIIETYGGKVTWNPKTSTVELNIN